MNASWYEWDGFNTATTQSQNDMKEKMRVIQPIVKSVLILIWRKTDGTFNISRQKQKGDNH